MCLGGFVFHDCASNKLWYLWNNGISEGGETVHPVGNPISHSTHVGFNAPPTCAFSIRELREYWAGPALFFASRAVGVANRSLFATAVARSSPPLPGLFALA